MMKIILKSGTSLVSFMNEPTEARDLFFVHKFRLDNRSFKRYDIFFIISVLQELAVITGSRRQATVSTRSDVELLCISALVSTHQLHSTLKEKKRKRKEKSSVVCVLNTERDDILLSTLSPCHACLPSTNFYFLVCCESFVFVDIRDLTCLCQ